MLNNMFILFTDVFIHFNVIPFVCALMCLKKMGNT